MYYDFLCFSNVIEQNLFFKVFEVRILPPIVTGGVLLIDTACDTLQQGHAMS